MRDIGFVSRLSGIAGVLCIILSAGWRIDCWNGAGFSLRIINYVLPTRYLNFLAFGPFFAKIGTGF